MKVFALAAALVLSLGFGGSAIAAPLPVVKEPCDGEILVEEVSRSGDSYCTFLNQRILRPLDEHGNQSSYLAGNWNSNGFELSVHVAGKVALLYYDWSGNFRDPNSLVTQQGRSVIRDLSTNDALALRSLWLSFVYN